MQHDVARKIGNLASRRDQLSESEVSHLMTLCRKFLEHLPKQERQQYPILGFFCDWSLHVTLDRSMEGFSVLKRLNDTLVEVSPVADDDLVIRRITEVISFPELRREMSELLHRIDVVNMSRRARELYEAIKANPLKQGCWIVGVAVVEVDYSQFGKDGKKSICLQILTSDTTQIVVPMAAPEVFGPAHT